MDEKDIDITQMLSKFKKRERDFIFAVRRHGKQGVAAREAGYSEKSADVTASRLMQREDIREAIKTLYAMDCKSLCISQDSVLIWAKEILDRCMQATPVMKYDTDSGEWIESGVFQFDSNGANKALANIIKVAGLEKKDVNLKAGEGFDLNVTVIKNNEPVNN